MNTTDELKAHRIVRAYLDRVGRVGAAAARRIYLVSYPRSGSTLVRKYLSILQGCPQRSIYHDDVVDAATIALTRALDHVEVIKSHRLPPGDDDIIYIVRDGRNATLSFLYLSFLSGGHRLTKLSEAWDGIRQLDEVEGSWGEHVARALGERGRRRILFVRYEDLIRNPHDEMTRIACFMAADLPSEVIASCLRLASSWDGYSRKPLSGYTYEPDPGSIYDLLKRYRGEDYWRHIFDSRCRSHFHERGGTGPLLHFDYERSTDWWKE
ncbi:MAG: sulfotransferase [Rhodospirillaceae bacterium]|jgi:hypothetical protein|nr:sulfotransferase [Rhodospirillaceae bacterium]